MRAVVVGGTGFLGRAVVRCLLDRDASVTVLSRTPPEPGLLPPDVGWVRGDVSIAGLGLASEADSRVVRECDTLFNCVGSVDWHLTAARGLATHVDGVRELLAFITSSHTPPKLVHASSVLVFGRVTGTVGNRDLEAGQRFRNWYEFSKFKAEQLLRESAVDWTVVRLGPLLGVDGGRPPARESGLPAILPFLLRGYPIYLAAGGAFPCYAAEVNAAADVMVAAADAPAGATWTWFDPARPTLAHTLAALTSAWGVLPRVLSSRRLGRAVQPIAPALGAPKALIRYAEPWVDFASDILDDIPVRPTVPSGYLAATSTALRAAGVV